MALPPSSKTDKMFPRNLGSAATEMIAVPIRAQAPDARIPPLNNVFASASTVRLLTYDNPFAVTPEFDTRRALKYIELINSAGSATDLAIKFGVAIGYLTAAAELNSMKEDEWGRLIDIAEHAYDNHPKVVVKSGNL